MTTWWVKRFMDVILVGYMAGCNILEWVLYANVTMSRAGWVLVFGLMAAGLGLVVLFDYMVDRLLGGRNVGGAEDSGSRVKDV